MGRVCVLETLHGGHDLVSLSLIGVHVVILGEEFERICFVRGFEPAETPVQEILDKLKQAKWLTFVCPKMAPQTEGRLHGHDAALESCHTQADTR